MSLLNKAKKRLKKTFKHVDRILGYNGIVGQPGENDPGHSYDYYPGGSDTLSEMDRDGQNYPVSDFNPHDYATTKTTIADLMDEIGNYIPPSNSGTDSMPPAM